MSLFTTTIMILLVMDPLGNIPIFLSVLKSVDARRRRIIIIRECVIALIVLALFLFYGHNILEAMGISMPALSVAGGIILFIIAIKMVYPPKEAEYTCKQDGEPFIVPLAIPLVAGPSAMAIVMLLAARYPGNQWPIFWALCIAWMICSCTLLASDGLRRLLRKRGLLAMERLMGMILTTLAVQMFLTGISKFFYGH